jgi:excisionase family DNA binding protein
MATGAAAALLGVSPKTVTAWAAAGTLPSTRTRGGHYRYQHAKLIALRARVGRYDIPAGIRSGTAWHPHAPRRPRGVTRQLVWHLHDQGLTGRQIARQLTICEPVVRHHLHTGRRPRKASDPRPTPPPARITMNVDQQPTYSAEHPDACSLTRVVPGHLDYDQVLQGLVQAIEEVRANMAVFTRYAERDEHGHAARGDRYGTALCRGQAQVGERAVDAIDEAIAGAFDIWYQLDTPAERPGPGLAPPGPDPIPRPR